MIVYKITNTTNGMVYIGQTRFSLDSRWQGHWTAAKSWGANQEPKTAHGGIQDALFTFGIGSFTIEEIYKAKTIKELDSMEQFFIILHQSADPIHGYNLARAGRFGKPRTSPMRSPGMRAALAVMSRETSRRERRTRDFLKKIKSGWCDSILNAVDQGAK